MTRHLSRALAVMDCTAAAAGLVAEPTAVRAQSKAKAENVPEIPFTSVPNFFKLPPDLYFGEGIGIATNSKGHVFVYTRSGDTRLLEFDQNGTYVREIGQGLYGLEFAHAVRVDKDDNIWVVDEGTNMVIKFSPDGNRVLLVIGRRPEPMAGVFESTLPAAPAEKYRFGRPTDVTWDPQGNIFVSDGYVNSRVVKYDRNGRFLKSVGTTRGSAPSQLNTPHSITADAQGNIYVGDRGNARVQVFDNDLILRAIYDTVGNPWAVCVSPPPNQFLFVSNSYPDSSPAAARDITGEVYKMELNGKIPFTATEILSMPAGMYLGEAAGVATNSKGDIYVYTRTGNPTITLGTSRAVSHGGSRLFMFDRTGKFVREIGQGSYGMLQAQQVRVDPQDNVWAVDQMSTQVMKFDGTGRVQMLLSRKPEVMRVPALPLTPRPTGLPIVQPDPEPPAAPGGGAAPPAAGGGRGGAAATGAGTPGESFQRPTDVAWDKAGNIYVADGYGNARVAKYEPSGRYVKSWGRRGTAPGEFNIVHGIAIDAQGNVYVGDEGNRRVQVFDAEGTFKTQFQNVGTPTALCISSGPKQFLYVAHTGDPDGMEDAAIYKVDLNGTIVGKLGRAGKELKQFGLVNAIDCRSENELLVGELSNWRVQKLTLGR